MRAVQRDYVSDPGLAHGRPEWFWTGRAPDAPTPGVLADGTMTSIRMPNLNECTKQGVLDYFDNTWCLTEVLFSSLQGEEAFYRLPYHNLRHPMIFYYGHPAALYINKLRVAGLLKDPVNTYYEHIFETGVDEMSWDDMSKNEMEWPPVAEVTEYRRKVYRIVHRVIEDWPFETPTSWECPMWSVFMGMEHERIHLETSSMLLRELPLRLLKRPQAWPAYHPALMDSANRKSPVNKFIECPTGDVTLGKAHDWPTFGWDNEYGQREFCVKDFSATALLISNGEFLEFVREGGYSTSSYWSEQGWKWRSFRNAKWPTFWEPVGPAGLHQYMLRLLFETVELPLAAPAVVNHHEAKAYCGWLSAKEGLTGHAAYRLLTEPEYYRLLEVAKRDSVGRIAEDPVMEQSGDEMRQTRNVNLAYGAESPVDAFAPTKMGFHDVSGNVWQWCEDNFAALPNSWGVHTMYDDFSTPCYDGQHNIIQGGSFISTGDLASFFARYHFRPHFFQHAGFRVVKGNGPPQMSHIDSPPPHVGNWNPTSTPVADGDTGKDELLGREVLTHFVDEVRGRPLGTQLQAHRGAFAREYVREVLEGTDVKTGSALEIGCSVGAVCFELARHFKQVVGLDLEGEHVQVAKKLQQDDEITVVRKVEGKVTDTVRVKLPLKRDIKSRVVFRHMDPCGIAPDIGEFDVVLITNILERIASPKAPLLRMGGACPIVKRGGVVVVASTCDWKERVSSSQLWLSGTEDQNGEKKQLSSSLQAALGDEFKLMKETDIPLLVPEQGRKYQLYMSNVTIWKYGSA
ncbi:unnamed protein product [Ostreobium quekettii]|uniref:Generic methyltransferase n=1 Tax=Ostreobium quekettii TaxID=121088 RepID=A0A8S1IN84_9CHLO|nr:unnamed protein product [Ostreobium quekettii]